MLKVSLGVFCSIVTFFYFFFNFLYKWFNMKESKAVTKFSIAPSRYWEIQNGKFAKSYLAKYTWNSASSYWELFVIDTKILQWRHVNQLYVIIMSRMSFRVNLHSKVGLNFKEPLSRSRQYIWNLSDSNG